MLTTRLNLCLLISSLCLFVAGGSSSRADEPEAIKQWTDAHQHALLDEYETFLPMPNVATELVAIRRNADALVSFPK